MPRRGGTVLALAACVGGRAAEGRQASARVDPVTSALYVAAPPPLAPGASLGILEDAPAQLAVVRPAQIAVSAIACGTLCRAAASGRLAGLLRGRGSRQEKPRLPARPKASAEAAAEEEEGVQGSSLTVKVFAAALVGVAASSSVRWTTRPRPARRASATAAKATAVVAPGPDLKEKELGCTSPASAGLPEWSWGSEPRAELEEPHPELDPDREEYQEMEREERGSEEQESEQDTKEEDDGLVPGRKGFVSRRRTMYEEKAEAEQQPRTPKIVRRPATSSQAKLSAEKHADESKQQRRPVYHRINSFPDVHAASYSDTELPLRTRPARESADSRRSNPQISFFRICT